MRDELLDHEYEPLHAPELIELEILNALRRLVRRGALSGSRADAAIDDLSEARVIRYSHAPLRGRVWELRDALSSYDASYLALAEALDEPRLLTSDRGLARGAECSLGSDRVRLIE